MKGTWPMGTPSQQEKEFGFVMFDEFGRDADERGELTPKQTPAEKAKKELLDYVDEIEGRAKRTRKLYIGKDNLEGAKKQFQMLREASEDAIGLIEELEEINQED